MNDRTAEQILQRRRVQNREAQRRFREKKNLQRTLNQGSVIRDHARQPSGAALADAVHEQRAYYSTEDCTSLPNLSFSEALDAELRHDGGCWDTTTSIEALLVDDAGFFGYDVANDHGTPQMATPQSSEIVDKSIIMNDNPTLTTFGSYCSPAATQIDGRPPPHMTDSSPSSHAQFPSGGGPQISAQETYAPLSPASTSNSSNTRTPSEKGLSPLHMAAKKGSDCIVRLLLRHNSDCNELDSEGLSPLMYAVIYGHAETTRLLLKHGAHIAAGSDDDEERPHSSAIHWAVFKRQEAVLRVLLEHCQGDKMIDHHDEMGRAPLHIAIDMEFEAGVSLLLESGADPSQKTRSSSCS